MENNIVPYKNSLEKVSRFTLLEDAIIERERVALDGIDRLGFTAKCFIVLESIGLTIALVSIAYLVI